MDRKRLLSGFFAEAARHVNPETVRPSAQEVAEQEKARAFHRAVFGYNPDDEEDPDAQDD